MKRFGPLWFLGLACCVRAVEPATTTIDFAKHIQPLLAERCYSCHGADKQESGLRWDLKSSALKGGLSGPAILPGDSANSRMIHLVAGLDPELVMPQKGPRLTPEQISLLRAWIDQGAVWPDGGVAKEEEHWAFKPAKRHPVPRVDQPQRARNPIDSFILAKLKTQQLAPSPEAERRVLIRRLTFDLHGLPPDPGDVQRFVSDPRPDAYERLVDELLASPRYGERWARHWLDVVHYGDSHGYDKDKPRRNAWPYRDYVIAALNADKPYSRFVQEQLAADAMFPNSPDLTPALGFISAGPWDFVGHVELPETKTDGLIARYNDRDDMVMSTMSTFLSLTVHCARCHNHKFDPISQRDYYSLQAVFAGVDRADREYDSDPTIQARRRNLRVEKKELLVRLTEISNALAHATSGDLRESLRSGLTRLSELDREMKSLPAPQKVYAAASDFPREGSFVPPRAIRTVHLLRRGDVKNPANVMAPAALSRTPGLDHPFECADAADERARRAALAKWITDERNTLARRSIVNRIWQYHFGRGLVDTPNDFGRMGGQPSHAELLDWLAFWFMDNGESLKNLHRLILASATWRQSSAALGSAQSADADNRFLWRMNRRRLDAEEIRDALLRVSGNLNLQMGGPSVQMFHFKDDHSPVYDYSRYDIDHPQSRRRSVYRFIVRSVPDPLMDCLDAADPNLLVPKRNATLTALQALSMLNNSFVVRQAEHFASHVRANHATYRSQIEAACQSAWCRAPGPDEIEMLSQHAREHGLPSVCRLIFNSNEFIFID
jgi:hypothetical protein